MILQCYGPILGCLHHVYQDIKLSFFLNSKRIYFSHRNAIILKINSKRIFSYRSAITLKVNSKRIYFSHRSVITLKINECIKLNEEYQKSFQKTKKKLKESHNEKQFEFR